MKKKILLIEDDVAVRENTEELLELSNYSVVTAANGKIGVEEAKRSNPDIIICDIMMPEMDGYEVLQILSKNNTTKYIPFIFLTAKTERKDIRKGMDMGADDYLTKPFNESELLSAIESRLAKVALIEENLKKGHNNSNKKSNELKNINELKDYIIKKAKKYMIKPGEIIYNEGDHSNYVFLIDYGVVKTFKIDEQGKELITNINKDGELFGFTSFLHNMTYSETAATIEETVLYRILKHDLKNILNANPTATLNLVDYLTDNVAEFKEQLLQMAYSSVRKKTANTIIQFSEKIKKTVDGSIRISRNDLASVAGIATETFIRTLSGLKKEGLIDIEGRNIKVLDLKSLMNIV
jgi:DNA-binding response OmpR family regulator